MTKAYWRGKDVRLCHVSGNDRTKVFRRKRRILWAKYLDQRVVNEGTLEE